jgi:hypothetical protein
VDGISCSPQGTDPQRIQNGSHTVTGLKLNSDPGSVGAIRGAIFVDVNISIIADTNSLRQAGEIFGRKNELLTYLKQAKTPRHWILIQFEKPLY